MVPKLPYATETRAWNFPAFHVLEDLDVVELDVVVDNSRRRQYIDDVLHDDVSRTTKTWLDIFVSCNGCCGDGARASQAWNTNLVGFSSVTFFQFNSFIVSTSSFPVIKSKRSSLRRARPGCRCGWPHGWRSRPARPLKTFSENLRRDHGKIIKRILIAKKNFIICLS